MHESQKTKHIFIYQTDSMEQKRLWRDATGRELWGLASPDERVQQIRAQLAAGTYWIDVERLAEQLLRHWF